MTNRFFKIIISGLACPVVALGWLVGCQTTETVAARPPDWSHNASIYEVNLRQYSEEGTLTGFREHLPRLKAMGVDILWFMPIHPVGEKNRKGSLGSYYSVQDYLALDPNLGTMQEFKSLVAEIHELDMHVIIDWVANHTSWDNPLIQSHPEWYTKDGDGNFIPPVPDWTDVIDLNYDQRGLWDYQIDAMSYWVREVGIDGFRCDVAGMVPLEFWRQVRVALDNVKPVFMLAEAEGPEFHQDAFDMTYAWNLHHLMTDIASGKRQVDAIDSLLQVERAAYPAAAYRMQFTSNHDENSWKGTVIERLGEGAETFAVLACTITGMPLIYSGQEAGLSKRLAFFEKDAIIWQEHRLAQVYETLLKLKKRNAALGNGMSDGMYERLVTSNPKVFAFRRWKGDDKLMVVLNLTSKSQMMSLKLGEWHQDLKDVFSGAPASAKIFQGVEFGPWQYVVLTN